jgi:hypothetical protein
MPNCAFRDLDAMIHQIEAEATEFPDPLAGVLVEGIAATIAPKMPPSSVANPAASHRPAVRAVRRHLGIGPRKAWRSPSSMPQPART